jgi:leucyl/phenylalanyl-tRNA---protein transferase
MAGKFGAMEPIPLTPEVLISAYVQGIFPMDVEGEIEWFSPDPRTVLPLDGLKITRSLRQSCRKFEVRVNSAFEQVMRACADRPEGTWINDEIVKAYTRLHHLGFAHSVESWRDGELAGGLYGVAIGGAFFGESMFHRRTDASKVALVALVDRMNARGFTLLDVQFTTEHLERLGAVEIPRRTYLSRLKKAVLIETRFAEPCPQM